MFNQCVPSLHFTQVMPLYLETTEPDTYLNLPSFIHDLIIIFF